MFVKILKYYANDFFIHEFHRCVKVCEASSTLESSKNRQHIYSLICITIRNLKKMPICQEPCREKCLVQTQSQQNLSLVANRSFGNCFIKGPQIYVGQKDVPAFESCKNYNTMLHMPCSKQPKNFDSDHEGQIFNMLLCFY